jgi:hypothetical protein
MRELKNKGRKRKDYILKKRGAEKETKQELGAEERRRRRVELRPQLGASSGTIFRRS